MNTTINHHRLDALAQEIARLDAALLESERDALSVVGDEASCATSIEHVTAARIALDRALRAYFIEAEFIRRGARRAA